MNKSSVFNIATIIAPVFAFFVAGSLVFYEVHRLGSLEGQLAQTTTQLRQISKLMTDMAAQPQSGKIPAAAITPTEQVDYLNTLRAYADAGRVRLTRWNNTPGGGNGHPLPPGVFAICSNVEVGGNYQNIRGFLYDLLRSRRLINMTDLKWDRSQWPTTHLAFTLTRYTTQQVAPPIPQAASAAQPPSATPAGPGAPPALQPAGSRRSTPAADHGRTDGRGSA